MSSDNTYTHYDFNILKHVIQHSANKGAKRITLTGGEFLLEEIDRTYYYTL